VCGFAFVERPKFRYHRIPGIGDEWNDGGFLSSVFLHTVFGSSLCCPDNNS